MNVYIEQSSSEYVEMFKAVGHSIVSDPLSADLICFTGGEDVTASLYGEKSHPYTGSFLARDHQEKKLFQEAVELNIPMVGICRGGQFLNVMNGGKMYQHVTKHLGDHFLIDSRTGVKVLVSSTHHQMMRAGASGILVAYAEQGGTKEHMPKLNSELSHPLFILDEEPDTEVVYYPHTRSLCFQPHPEYDYERYAGMTAYFFSLVNKYLSKDN